MVEMELVGVRVELPNNTPLILLREKGGQGRLLPIFIGAPEATAIALGAEGLTPRRPMTHDLLRNVLDELGVSVRRITVTDLRDGTFYAEIELVADGTVHTIDSRPSDAVALAVRVDAPIFATEEVLAEAGYLESDEPVGASENPSTEEVVEEFRQFIEQVNPEDFAS